MAFAFSSCSHYNNYRDTFFSSMVKQKLEIKFWNGVMLGALVTFFICSGIVGEFFVSKEVFKLNTIYIDGRMYQLCRIK